MLRDRHFGIGVLRVIVVDVSEIEVRLEIRRIEQDRSLVQGLRLGQFVAGIADVREIDQGGDQIGILLEGPAVGLPASSMRSGVPSSSSEPIKNTARRS